MEHGGRASSLGTVFLPAERERDREREREKERERESQRALGMARRRATGEQGAGTSGRVTAWSDHRVLARPSRVEEVSPAKNSSTLPRMRSRQSTTGARGTGALGALAPWHRLQLCGCQSVAKGCARTVPSKVGVTLLLRQQSVRATAQTCCRGSAFAASSLHSASSLRSRGSRRSTPGSRRTGGVCHHRRTFPRPSWARHSCAARRRTVGGRGCAAPTRRYAKKRCTQELLHGTIS